MSDSEDLLIVADSERDANMLYAVGLLAPEQLIYFRIGGHGHLVAPEPAIKRAGKKAPHCKVLSYDQCLCKLRREVKRPGLAAVINFLLRERSRRKIFVPANFPFGLARELRNYRIRLRVKKDGLFPERAFKRADEIKKISAALMMAEVGLAEGMQALKTSRIGKAGILLYHGAPLTAEKLRGVMDTAILLAGGQASHTIVAGGRQACDPYEPGHGPLRAGEPLVLEVSPRSQKTGYFGHITRTAVRGRASEGVRKLYDAVAKAKDIALAHLRSSAKAAEVHAAVAKFFETEGHKTFKKGGRMQGFLHGTGHGVGLEIHEAPRLAVTSREVLAVGHVVSVEPGLHYPGLGGVRLGDVAEVTAQEARNLTKFEKVLEL